MGVRVESPNIGPQACCSSIESHNFPVRLFRGFVREGPVPALGRLAARQGLHGAIIAGTDPQPTDLAFSGGYWVPPTLFVDVDPQMNVAREEIFGPVTAVMPFTDEDEVIRLANDTTYGSLVAGYTASDTVAGRMAWRVNAGFTYPEQL